MKLKDFSVKQLIHWKRLKSQICKKKQIGPKYAGPAVHRRGIWRGLLTLGLGPVGGEAKAGRWALEAAGRLGGLVAAAAHAAGQRGQRERGRAGERAALFVRKQSSGGELAWRQRGGGIRPGRAVAGGGGGSSRIRGRKGRGRRR